MKELFLFKGKDTCKSRVGQILKRQKKLLNCKTVWEILLTSKVAEAETGSGRGGETSFHKWSTMQSVCYKCLIYSPDKKNNGIAIC